MDLHRVIRVLRPDAEFTINGDGYEGLTWIGPGEPPTLAECEATWPTVHTELLRAETETERRAAFETEADPLFFEWQRGEGTEQAWRDKVEEIRQRYPYPT